MSAKSNEIKLSGKFMVMWKEGTPPVVFCKKGVLRNFAKFTGKDSSSYRIPPGDCFQNLKIMSDKFQISSD